MKTPGKIKLTLYLCLLAGAALFTGLLIREGLPQVAAAVASAGWGIAAVGGFYFVLRLGMFRFLARMIARLANSPEWQSLVQSGQELDDTIRSLYSRRRAVIACCAWTILSLVLNSGEVWIALWALNLHATVVNAVILQSTILTVRNVGFAVPSGLGVQEGGYVLIGSLLGIDGTNDLALYLIARVRELALGIPGLVTWQVLEGRRLLRARAGPASS